jgi:hypothetical protein
LEPAHADDLWAADSLEPDGRSFTYLTAGPFSSSAAYRQWLCAHMLVPDRVP